MRVFGVVVLVSLAAGTVLQNPYVGSDAYSFWDDIKTVHRVLTRGRVPRFHGASRPFFETITNVLSGAEKAAFDRLSQGMLPDSGLDIVDDIPKNIPLYMKPCENAELEGDGHELMQLQQMRITLDPRHVKMKVDMQAEFLDSLNLNMTHHTVVTVDDVQLGGFQMSPMVLFDKTGSVCELYDNILNCPIQKGHMDVIKKVKIPGLDAVASLPKRLYNARVELLDEQKLVKCIHLFMDMRPDSEKQTPPVPGVTVIEPFPTLENIPAPPSPLPAALNFSVAATTMGGSSDNASAPLQVTSSGIPILQMLVEKAQPFTKFLQPKPEVPAAQPDSTLTDGSQASYSDLAAMEPVPQTTVPGGEGGGANSDGGSAPLEVFRSMVNLQKAAKAAGKEDPQRASDTVLLQQLQLRNLQEQLKHQEEINRDQQVEYNKLKAKLAELQPHEIEDLKKTVNELLSVKQAKIEEIRKEQADQAREHELSSKLFSMYQSLGLPASQLTFGLNPSNGFLSQLAAPASLITVPHISPAQTLVPKAQMPLERAHSAQQHVPDLQFLSQLDTILTQDPGTADAPAEEAPTAVQEGGETPTDSVEGEAAGAEVQQAPAEVQEAPSESPEPVVVEDELPDVSQIIASTPRYSNNNWGVSYMMDSLEDWIPQLCVPFVTLASDMSFSFCLPEQWQGELAIVITEPFTAEKGIFADLTSMSAPDQRASDANSTFQAPAYVGMSSMLIKQNYATLVVAFNPDNFVDNVGYFVTEIMGAMAAFVDYAGEPHKTIITGVGWGGVLATQLLERHGGCRIHGGLVIDSPIGNARWQGDYYGDILTLFEWISPKAYETIMSTRFGAISHLLLESWEEVGRPYIFQALTPLPPPDPSTEHLGNPRELKLLEVLRALNIKCSFKMGQDKYDEPSEKCLYDEFTNAIRKAAMYTLSFRLAFNGQDSFDNYRTLYVPEVFVHLNEQVPRKMADEGPLNHQTRYLETSGMLRVPLALLNTPRDPEVPEWQASEYLRKQHQMCETSRTGVEIVNDTSSEFFGHAHTDTMGKDLAEQFLILDSMISTMRKNDESALSQRAWLKAPVKLFDPELGACPSQAQWYKDMLINIRASVKSGTLQSSGKVDEMVEAHKAEATVLDRAAELATPKVIDAAAEAGDGMVRSAIAGATEGVDSVAATAGQVVNGETVASADEAVGGVVEGAAGAVNAVVERVDEAASPLLMPTNNVQKSLQQDEETVVVPSYTEAMELGQAPTGEDAGKLSSKSKYQRFLERTRDSAADLPATPPHARQSKSWADTLFGPIADAAAGARHYPVGSWLNGPRSRMGSYFWRPHRMKGASSNSPAVSLLEIGEVDLDAGMEEEEVSLAADPSSGVTQLGELAGVVHKDPSAAESELDLSTAVQTDQFSVPTYTNTPQHHVDEAEHAAAMFAHGNMDPAAMKLMAPVGNGGGSGVLTGTVSGPSAPPPQVAASGLIPWKLVSTNQFDSIVQGAQSLVSSFNRARHSKLPASIFKPIFTANTKIGIDSDSFVDKLGHVFEHKIEEKLGITDEPLQPTAERNVQEHQRNMFPMGRDYSAAMDEKRAVLSKLRGSHDFPTRSLMSIGDQTAAPAPYMPDMTQWAAEPQLQSQPQPQPVMAQFGDLPTALQVQPQPQFLMPQPSYVQYVPMPVLQPSAFQQFQATPPQDTMIVPSSPAMSEPMLQQITETPPTTTSILNDMPAPQPLATLMGATSTPGVMGAMPAPPPSIASQAPAPETNKFGLNLPSLNIETTRQGLDAMLGKALMSAAGGVFEKVSNKLSGTTPQTALEGAQNKLQTRTEHTIGKRLQESFDSKMTKEMGSLTDLMLNKVGRQWGSYSQDLLGSMFHPGKVVSAALGYKEHTAAATPSLPTSGALQAAVAAPAQNGVLPAPTSIAQAVDQRILSFVAPKQLYTQPQLLVSH